MEKIVTFDKQGRVYLPEEIRTHLRFKTFVAKVKEEGVYLQPIEEDPLKALSILGRKKFKGKSIEQLKKEARAEIEENAAKKLRRY